MFHNFRFPCLFFPFFFQLELHASKCCTYFIELNQFMRRKLGFLCFLIIINSLFCFFVTLLYCNEDFTFKKQDIYNISFFNISLFSFLCKLFNKRIVFTYSYLMVCFRNVKDARAKTNSMGCVNTT